jgi:4'-phosphopantetheinyl transferase
MSMVRSWPAATEGPDGPLALPPDRVDCWFVSLANLPSDAEEVASSLLSPDEHERAKRFRFEHHRKLYVRSHAALRLLLARYLFDVPASVLIVRDATGRPILATPAGHLHFNLSHSDDGAIVAFSHSAPVGIDIEVVRDIRDFVSIAVHYFARTEVEHLLRLDPEQRLAGFYVTWTRKEAFVKALGLGLSFPLDVFCTGAQDRPPHLSETNGFPYRGWTMADLAPSDQHKAAFAVQHPNAAILCREAKWPWMLDYL